MSCQMEKYSIQGLDSDRSVCMTTIYYSGLISAVPTNEQLLGESAKFQIDTSKTEELVGIYTDRQADMAKSYRPHIQHI